ncbi:hypothetical protein BaRGS_00039151, partial [Batillaria attramentaria]
MSTSRKGKRFLPVVSPVNQQTKKRTRRLSDSDMDRLIQDEVGMDSSFETSGDSRGDFGVNVEAIQLDILSRVNSAIAVSSSGSSSGNGGDTSVQAEQSTFVQQVVPAIVASVAMAVGEVLKSLLKQTRSANDGVSDVTRKLQQNVFLMRYENDRMEQYSRRETIRIVGVKEEEEEDVEKKVLEIFKETGAEVSPDDISVCHRIGKGKRGRPILAKFVSRKKKKEVMRKKKALREKDRYKNVYLNDDLTQLRARLLKMVKEASHIDKAWVVEGKILCTLKHPPGLPPENRHEKTIVVESPDDLFDAGFKDIDFQKLGLSSLV